MPISTRQGNNNLGTFLVSEKVESLPIINRFLNKLKVDSHFDRFVPRIDQRQKLQPSQGLSLLLRNLLIARDPLYALCDWAAQYDATLLGIQKDKISLLNDDRIGRCLDSLFNADRMGLITELVVEAVHEFDLDVSEFHNDSTSITFTGSYENASGLKKRGMQAKNITHGHNKDHRPDLKQLLFILTTNADGAVPIWCKVDHGNLTDDQTHIQTWNALFRITGTHDFLYVADSKLCTRENMLYIDSRGGRFITVLPRTRREDAWFRDWIQTNEIVWTELVRRKNPRYKNGPDDVYRGFESPLLSSEGFRIVWIWGSQKEQQDRESRDRRIRHAIDELEVLRKRMASPKSRFRSISSVERAAEAILKKTQAHRWFEVIVETKTCFEYKQAGAGRPSASTQFVQNKRSEPVLNWKLKDEEIKYDCKTDGLFPLILNDKNISMRNALKSYKHQPTLEKRFEQLKSVYNVMPVFLKSPSRIEAFLYLYFIVLFVQSLIERELRKQMKSKGIPSLPLYPENRHCKAPTADRIFSIFSDVRKHTLQDSANQSLNHFYDSLTEIQCKLLKLLDISQQAYFGYDVRQ